MKELADQQGKLNHTYNTMETSEWNNRCSEGHGLRHAGGLHVAKWPYVAQDKGDDWLQSESLFWRGEDEYDGLWQWLVISG